jgi:arylsulfatase
MPQEKLGTLDDSFTLNVDLAPTILGAAGLTPPLGMQGRNFADLYLKDDTKWRDEFYYEHPTHLSEQIIPKSSALVRKEWKYILYDNYKYESLFHLSVDPLELNDTYAVPEHQGILNEMRKRYQELKDIVAMPPPFDGTTV